MPSGIYVADGSGVPVRAVQPGGRGNMYSEFTQCIPHRESIRVIDGVSVIVRHGIIVAVGDTNVVLDFDSDLV